MKLPFLLTLGRYSKQAGDEGHLPQNVPFFGTSIRKWWIIPMCPPGWISTRFCASPTSVLIFLHAHMVHRPPTACLSGGRAATLPSSGCTESPQR